MIHAGRQVRAWFEDNPLPMWVFDPDTFSFLDVNDAAVSHYGYARHEFLSMTILDIRPPEDVPDLVSRVRAGFPGRTQKIEARHWTRTGNLIDVEIYAQQITWNGRRAEIIQAHDVSERKRAADALDAQKRTMARELHDSVGQTLTALLTKLAVLPQSDECIALASQTLNDIRTFSYLLHPPMLDEEGIRAALEVYLEEFAKRSGIDVEIAIPEDLPRFSEELEITLFRVVQESLTNIHRHSGSTTAVVRLVHEAGSLMLEIRDRGRGRAHDARTGVGIAGMRERVAQLGGELAIESSCRGTTIRAVFPS